MFPPEVADDIWWDLESANEIPLWPYSARSGFTRRIRLSISGINRLKVSIRIDERAKGRRIGRLVLTGWYRGAQLDEVRSFRPSSKAMRELDDLIAKSDLWSISPEHYVLKDGDDICVDGEQLVFERTDARGYRIASANAQCNAPLKVLRIARQIIEISGASEALGLLN